MSSSSQVYWSPETQAKNLRWNYAFMIGDGAAYMAGMAFMTSETLMPNMIKDLGGADWMIALAPSFLLLGSMLTPLLLVHRIEKLTRYQPFVMRLSIPQRIIPLLAALGLFFCWDLAPRTCLVLAALNQLFMGFFGGFGSAAFWVMYGKLIPANRRSSNSAWRNSIGLLVGIAAGAVIARVLTSYPGRIGYGILLTIQSSLLILSGFFFSMLREYPDPPHEARPHRSLSDVLLSIPGCLRRNRDFTGYILFRSLGQAHVIIIPFLALSFRSLLALPDVYLGYFVQAQMFGGLLGNLLAGVWGDKAGPHKPLIAARLSGILLCLASPFVTHPAAAITCFFLVGLLININNTSENMLILELADPEERPALVAMQSILLVPTLLLFGFLSKWLYQLSGNLLAEAIASALFLGLSLVTLLRIRNPRQA